jgi:YidC/Oxa1 family membrane protein insertase
LRAAVRSAATASIPFRVGSRLMERRVFIAILLAFVVLYGFQLLVPPPPPPDAVEGSAAPATAPPSDSSAATPPPNAAPAPAEPAPVEAASPPAVTTEPAEREIVVETAAVEAVLTNRGGRVMRWKLKAYRDNQGVPVDLVPSAIPPEQPRPFSLQVEDPQLTKQLNAAIYRVEGDTNGRVDATSAAASLTFEFEDAAGVHVTKTFRFEPDNYVVAFSASVTRGGETLNPTIAWGPGLGDIGATSGGGTFFTGNYVQPPQAIYHRDGSIERINPSDIAEQPVHEGQFRFAGIDDHYFLAAAVNPGQARLEFGSLALPGAGDTQRQLLTETIRFAEPPKDVRFFIGPKQFDLLRSIDAELVRSIDYGIFGWMTVPLLTALKWLYRFTGNYGWAIVVLTILINLAMFPLRHKSMVAMRKMQAIQPQMKAIQDRYANLKVTDPARQKMNTEVMNLYREKGVNPAAGCVPMLLTMPVLLAFFSLLSMSIELRGAPFGWWIQDLSASDPYFVLPALMGVTMFWQQRITPTTVDPTQQKVMMIMPVMFTAMMSFSASGVVLYWFVGQVWAIGQQYVTNWLIGPPQVAAVRPPAERRIKSAGTGKTPGAGKR